MHRFDLWLGKRMFIPIAIRLCQLLRVSQYALHAYIWLGVFFFNLSKGPHVLGWFWYTFMALMTLAWVLIAGLAPDSVRRSFAPIRLMFVWLFFLDFPLLVLIALDHQPLTSMAEATVKDWMIVLAEYALTIHTIPPLEAREKKKAAKLARQQT